MRIEVWDNGIGMNPDDLPSIFDELDVSQKASRPRKRSWSRTLFQNGCDLLGLSLRVQSKPGIGRASLTLPRSDIEPESLKNAITAWASVVPATHQPACWSLIIQRYFDCMQSLLSGWGPGCHRYDSEDAKEAVKAHSVIDVALMIITLMMMP